MTTLETPQPTAPSRRSVLRAAAWSVPAVSAVSAAPAWAGSTGIWSVASSSWEGTAAGVRDNNGTLRMAFTITVPASTTVSGAQLALSFSGAVQRQATITAGWTTAQAADTNTTAFTIVHADDLTEGTYPLNFVLQNVAGGDVNGTENAVFSSSTPTTGPTVSFDILATNVDNYITSPHV